MPSYFYAVRLCTAYAATLLCSPFMRSCFCAVMLFYADEAFTQSRFYAAEPFTQAHFTQLNPLRRHILRSCAIYADMLFALCWMEMVLRGNGSEGGSWEPWGWPCPCAALWVSRPSQHDPPPASRRRWNPGRIFHGWRPWCAPASPAFPAAGKPPGPPTDPAAGRSRRCR